MQVSSEGWPARGAGQSTPASFLLAPHPAALQVFRTYNASVTLDRLLAEDSGEETVDGKAAEYNRANKEVGWGRQPPAFLAPACHPVCRPQPSHTPTCRPLPPGGHPVQPSAVGAQGARQPDGEAAGEAAGDPGRAQGGCSAAFGRLTQPPVGRLPLPLLFCDSSRLTLSIVAALPPTATQELQDDLKRAKEGRKGADGKVPREDSVRSRLEKKKAQLQKAEIQAQVGRGGRCGGWVGGEPGRGPGGGR